MSYQMSHLEPPSSKHPAQVIIVDYKLGNVRSVSNALEALNAEVAISNDPAMLASAQYLILPGVGAFEDGMRNLKALGLVETLGQLVFDQKKPILGICMGMQLMAKVGYENGSHEGLGWLDAEVKRFEPEVIGRHLKVPHVGWNDVRFTRDNPLFMPSDVLPSFYFVHSYYMQCADPMDAIGLCDYGVEFAAVVQRDNICGVQFHPEKSQKHGLALLGNFLANYSQISVASV